MSRNSDEVLSKLEQLMDKCSPISVCELDGINQEEPAIIRNFKAVSYKDKNDQVRP